MLIERAALRNHGGYIVPRTPLFPVSPIHSRRKGALLSHYGAYVAADMMAGVFYARSDEKGEEEEGKKKRKLFNRIQTMTIICGQFSFL